MKKDEVEVGSIARWSKSGSQSSWRSSQYAKVVNGPVKVELTYYALQSWRGTTTKAHWVYLMEEDPGLSRSPVSTFDLPNRSGGTITEVENKDGKTRRRFFLEARYIIQCADRSTYIAERKAETEHNRAQTLNREKWERLWKDRTSEPKYSNYQFKGGSVRLDNTRLQVVISDYEAAEKFLEGLL